MSSLFSKTITLGRDLKITDSEFCSLRDYIYEQCGIYIADNRKYLLENRLANRLKDLNLKDFGEYYYYLQFDKNKAQEQSKLFEVITTNETSFYRNPPQLKVFQENILPQVIEEQRRKGDKSLHIWSAGCSTGEEPYTLAMIISDVLGAEIHLWDVKITANDLSARVLEAAKQGIYSEYSLRTTPEDVVARYFVPEGKTFAVKPEIKKMVAFGQINLKDRQQPKMVPRSEMVFCRNVIIYFDDEMKKQVINAYYDNLKPGGFLIIGHSESLHNISRAFKPIHYPGAIIYQKEL